MADREDDALVDYEPEDDDARSHLADAAPPRVPPAETRGAGDSETDDYGGPGGGGCDADADADRSDGELETARAPLGLLGEAAAAPTMEAGVYLPPAKRRLLRSRLASPDASAAARSQRASWEGLKRTVHGTVNRLSVGTIRPLIRSLFSDANLLRGRGVLARSVLRAAQASPRYAGVYAALAAVVSAKLPEVGELLLTRCILAFRRGYKSKDYGGVSSTLALMGHLFNQGMASELLSLQILTVLLDGDPTEDSVDVAVGYLCIIGRRLAEVSPAGMHAVVQRMRGLLHEGVVGKRGQYRIESLLKIKKGGFKDFPSIEPELDLVEREDQIVFEIGLDEEGLKKEEGLDVFRFDEEWEENEREWERVRAEILGEDESDGETSGSEGSGDESEEEQERELPPEEKKTVVVRDLTETDLVHLRRTIYLTIMSSATFEECTHKLAKMDIPEGRESELVNMIIECCSQERTFLRYYGLVSGRFCLLHERWQTAFEEAFATQYSTIHRLETNKLRNVAKLFGHLLHTDSVSWSVLKAIHLNEDETTSSSRIFIKILVQEMAEAMGMGTLKARFDTDNPDPDGELAPEVAENAPAVAKDGKQRAAETREWFKAMFPKDNARNTRYAINFFTSIGLGPLTDGMREFLKNAPKLIMAKAQAQATKEADRKRNDSDASSVISTSSSSTSSFDSSSSSSNSSRSSYSSSSSSFSSYSSDSRDKRRKDKGGRGRVKKRRRSRSYYSSSSSSGSSKSSSSSYSRDSRKKSSPKKNNDKRRDRSASRDVASSDNKPIDADKDSKADASSSRRSVSASNDRQGRGRRRRSYSRSDSRSRSRSQSPSPPAKSSDKPSNPEKQRSRRSKRDRSPSYSSSSSRSASRSPPRRKESSGKKKRVRRDSRERSGSRSVESGRR